MSYKKVEERETVKILRTVPSAKRQILILFYIFRCFNKIVLFV